MKQIMAGDLFIKRGLTGECMMISIHKVYKSLLGKQRIRYQTYHFSNRVMTVTPINTDRYREVLSIIKRHHLYKFPEGPYEWAVKG